jgi:uncharacterized protein (TIGR02118 family)
MIDVTVMYPNQDGAKFDWNYYLTNHIPLVKKLLGSALKGTLVEQGLSGGVPGSKPTYTATVALRFDSVEAFLAAFGPHAAEIQKDIANYSSVAPVIQISEIKQL